MDRGNVRSSLVIPVCCHNRLRGWFVGAVKQGWLIAQRRTNEGNYISSVVSQQWIRRDGSLLLLITYFSSIPAFFFSSLHIAHCIPPPPRKTLGFYYSYLQIAWFYQEIIVCAVTFTSGATKLREHVVENAFSFHILMLPEQFQYAGGKERKKQRSL